MIATITWRPDSPESALLQNEIFATYYFEYHPTLTPPFIFLFFCHEAYKILIPRPEIEPMPPAGEA